MQLDELRSGRVLVTGATGFLGRHLLAELRSQGVDAVSGCGGPNTQADNDAAGWGVDLTDWKEADAWFDNFGPTHVFHLAGYNGGIQFNLDNPGSIFCDNTIMGLNVLQAAALERVGKVVSVVASCGSDCSRGSLLHPEDFLRGAPHHSVSAHGFAKRNLQLASSYFAQQYGLKAVCAMPTTLFGPGDSFDPGRTKVVGAMVRRFVDAADQNLDEVTCWGTGKPKRDLLYVKDAAKMLVEVMLGYDDTELPCHLGHEQEVSVAELADMVALEAGYEGRIAWDDTKPDGQMRKLLCVEGFRLSTSRTPLAAGLRAAVSDYRDQKGRAACATS